MCLSPMRLAASAKRCGSWGSNASGLPVLMAQKPQWRVQMSPKIMKVAEPFDQHSGRFGQRALSHTVCRRASRIICSTCCTFSGLGRRTFNQSGNLRLTSSIFAIGGIIPARVSHAEIEMDAERAHELFQIA
jgi:hypothetical protein